MALEQSEIKITTGIKLRKFELLRPIKLLKINNTTASNHVIRNIYNTIKMSTKDSDFHRVRGKFIQNSFDASIILLVRYAYSVRTLDRI